VSDAGEAAFQTRDGRGESVAKEGDTSPPSSAGLPHRSCASCSANMRNQSYGVAI